MCMSKSSTACGKCLTLFFAILIVFSFWVFISADYIRVLEDDLGLDVSATSNGGGGAGDEQPLILESDHLPMISPDKKIIYVASEEGLPIAHNFILRNPSVPVEKIVYRRPGHNSTIHVYPIQRDALLATNHNYFSRGDLPGLWAFIFIMIFTAFGLHLLLCRQLCGCNPSSSRDESASCESCFEFDPNLDLMDFDDPFDSPSSSPFGSPIKPSKQKSKPNKIMDELKQPLLIV